jgi:probable selenium-dependent hydroxylase accessory protein YqeC
VNYQFLDPWHQFLPRQPGHVLGCMGSGGKTSLLLALADLYRREGIGTLLCTTTASEPLIQVSARQWRPDEPAPSDPGEGVFVHGGLGDDGKWRGLAPEAVDRLSRVHPDRVILCEVDGAAKHPLKLYRAGEPCWPARTSLALVVMGAGAMGQTAGQAVHRLGRPHVTPRDVRDLPAQTALDWNHLAALLLDVDGYLDQVPGHVPAVLVLAGLGSVTDSIGLFDFAGRAMQNPRLPLQMFCEFGAGSVQMRTACRTGGSREPAG